ncbi:MAG: DNA-processing protein DprA, partial [Chloroflexota bacterium]|nr:DNA-processing protein DprA [Chloroflexota bacterium]
MIGVGANGPVARGPAADGRGVRGLPIPDRSHRGGWTALDLSVLDPRTEEPYWIALSLVPGVGPVGFARLLRRFGTGRAAWAAGSSLLEDLPRLPDDAAHGLARLRREGVAAVAGRVHAAVQRAGGAVVTVLDRRYPAALAAADPRPPVLYVAGDPASMEAPCVAIVGTRRATGYGRACAAEIADELGRAGVTVVSGLAIGIDGQAHLAAIAAGGRSVAVLPSPLDRIYPPRHRELAARLVATGGALVSELAPAQAHGKPDFARRNRIIAGLAQAVVVVEAPDHSGALLTVAAAIEYGREVFSVPGPIDSIASRGCNRLIADHQASIVTSAAALLHRIGAVPTGRPVSVASLSDTEALVLQTLLRQPGSIEELIARTRTATGPLASTLTLL